MIANELEMVRATRARTLSLAEGLSQAQLNYVPPRDGWPVGEVLDHIILAGRVNHDQIAELIELAQTGRRPALRLTFRDINVSPAFIPKSLLPFLELPFTLLTALTPTSVLDFMARTPIMSAQNPDATTPRRGRTYAELCEDLLSSLRELEALFASHPRLDYRAMTIQHPLLGVRDVPGLLRFTALHEQRHQAQFSAIPRSPSFPQGDTSLPALGDNSYA